MEIQTNKLKPYELNKELFDNLPKNDYDSLKLDIEKNGIKTELHITKSNTILCGHQRWNIAKDLGMNEVPVTYQGFKDEDQMYSFMVSHNAIANWATLDLAEINSELENIGPMDIDLLGIKDFVIEPIEKYEGSNSEIDTDNFGNDLEHTCPKCGFEFNE